MANDDRELERELRASRAENSIPEDDDEGLDFEDDDLDDFLDDEFDDDELGWDEDDEEL